MEGVPRPRIGTDLGGDSLSAAGAEPQSSKSTVNPILYLLHLLGLVKQLPRVAVSLTQDSGTSTTRLTDLTGG